MAHTQHDFELDSQHVALLEKEVRIANQALRAFPRGPMGLTPDAVRITPEWPDAKQLFDRAWTNLREFNKIYMKKYKKELWAERQARRSGYKAETGA